MRTIGRMKIYLAVQFVLFGSVLFMQATGRHTAEDAFVYACIAVNAFTAVTLAVQKLTLCAGEGKREVPLKRAALSDAHEILLFGAALLLTLLADTLLVLLDIRHTAGVFLFCCVQILYGFILYHRLPESRGKKKWLLSFFLLLIVPAAAAETGLLEALALFCFARLITNVIMAFCLAKQTHLLRDRLFAAGLLLFLGCDLCVGLRNLPVTRNIQDAAYAVNWLFYIPSQVLLVVSSD